MTNLITTVLWFAWVLCAINLTVCIRSDKNDQFPEVVAIIVDCAILLGLTIALGANFIIALETL